MGGMSRDQHRDADRNENIALRMRVDFDEGSNMHDENPYRSPQAPTETHVPVLLSSYSAKS